LFSGQQVERLVIAALHEVTLDEAMDRAGYLTEQPGDVVVPRRRQRMKLHGVCARMPSGLHPERGQIFLQRFRHL
jgi:hypothetical protein